MRSSAAADTDWGQVLALYDQLLALAPTPVVALNRAVAVAEVSGAEEGLREVESRPLPGYLPWHVARAELLVRLGRRAEAREAYDVALALSANGVERAHLARRRDEAE